MIISKPRPARGICFAWLPVYTSEGKVWLEFVRYEYDDHGLGGCSYSRLVPEALYRSGGYVTPPDPKRFCNNYRTGGPTPCHYPHCKYTDEHGVPRCGTDRVAFGEN